MTHFRPGLVCVILSPGTRSRTTRPMAASIRAYQRLPATNHTGGSERFWIVCDQFTFHTGPTPEPVREIRINIRGATQTPCISLPS